MHDRFPQMAGRGPIVHAGIDLFPVFNRKAIRGVLNHLNGFASENNVIAHKDGLSAVSPIQGSSVYVLFRNPCQREPFNFLSAEIFIAGTVFDTFHVQDGATLGLAFFLEFLDGEMPIPGFADDELKNLSRGPGG